jgi:hypothetical protein
MNDVKSFYQSKTLWGILSTVVATIGQYIQAQGGLTQVPHWLVVAFQVGGALLAVYGRYTATATLTTPANVVPGGNRTVLALIAVGLLALAACTVPLSVAQQDVAYHNAERYIYQAAVTTPGVNKQTAYDLYNSRAGVLKSELNGANTTQPSTLP